MRAHCPDYQNPEKRGSSVFNKYKFFQRTIEADFEVNTEIHRSRSVKYLGLWLDDNLNFTTHIKKLETYLAKYAGVLYRILNYLIHHTTKTLYYFFVYYKLQYGIMTWGSTNKSKLLNLNNV